MCNTTANQNFVLYTGYDVQASQGAGAPLTAIQWLANAYPLAQSSQPLNITDTLTMWATVTQATLELIAPGNGMSILVPSAQVNGLSSLQLFYPGAIRTISPDGGAKFKPNIIGSDHWTLLFMYTYQDEITQNMIPISFTATGEIDHTHTTQANLDAANSVLNPTLAYMQNATQQPDFDFWKFINFVSVSYYWVFLADFGQVCATAYQFTPEGNYDFSQPGMALPSSNNIFTNGTLFEIYYRYLQATVIPFLRMSAPNLTMPVFLPVNDSNRLEPVDTLILRSYACTQRQLKGWESFVISVLVADYALIGGAYTILIFIIGRWQKRRDQSICLVKIALMSRNGLWGGYPGEP